MRRAPLVLVLLAVVLGGVFVWIAAGPAPEGGGAWSGLASEPATRGMPPAGKRERERAGMAGIGEAVGKPGGRQVLEAGAPLGRGGARAFPAEPRSGGWLADLPMRTVEGVVRNADTSEPVDGAQVRFLLGMASGEEHVARTDAEGRFRLQWLALGALGGVSGVEDDTALVWAATEMWVVHPEYVDVVKVGTSADFAEELVAFYAEEAPLEIGLVASGAISGRVRGAASSGQAQRYVQAWSKAGVSPGMWSSFVVPCAEDGSFVLGDLAPGEYALLGRAGLPGFSALTSAALEPIALDASAGSAAFETAAVLEGAFMQPGLGTGPELTGVYRASVHVGAGEEVRVDLELRAAARVEGRVITTRADGLAVPVTESPGSARLTPLQVGLPAELALRERHTTEVDEGGRFVFDGLGPGTYRVDVLPAWGGVHGQIVTVAASGAVVSSEVRVPLPAVLAGVVQDEGGAPVARARIELESPGPAPASDALPAEVVTDADGRFELTGVPAGVPLALVVEPRDKDLGATAVPLAAMSSGELEQGLVVVLRPPLVLRGVVEEAQAVARNGDRIVGAQVEVVQRRGSLMLGRTRAVTNAQGEFTIEGLQGAPSEVRVRAWGFVEAGFQVDLSDPAAQLDGQPVGSAVTLALEPGLVVEGLVLDEGGAALGGVHVIAEAERDVHGEPLAPKRLSRTDAKGAFRFAGLADVEWTLAPQDPAYLVVARTPERVTRGFVQDGGRVELVLRHRLDAPRASVRFDVVRTVDGAVPEDLRVVGARDAAVHVDRGAVTITGLDAEVASLMVLGSGCAARVVPLQLTPGVELDLGLVELDPGVQATVRVEGAAPGTALQVELVPSKGPDGPPAGTPRVRMVDEGDAFRVAGLPRGTWHLRVVGANGQVAAELVELVDETFEHTVVLAE